MARNADAFVGIRVPRAVKVEWEEEAKRERRSLSNWILQRLSCNRHSQPAPEKRERAA